jgi:isopenicillin-N epimerase
MSDRSDRRGLPSRRGFLVGSGMAVAGGVGGLALHRRGLGGGPGPQAGPVPEAAAAPAAGDDWGAVRAGFELSPDTIHLSAMLIASHPRIVREAIERHRRGLDADPAVYLLRNKSRLQREVRRAAAGYLGGDAGEIALTDSTTMGLGLVYGGLRLRPGQEILTTEHDYFVTHESARLAAERAGATTRRLALYDDLVSVSGDQMVTRVRDGIRARTRVLGLTWVHSSTGLKLPVAAITEAVAAINRRRDHADRVLVCVDGVHGFGVEDVDAARLGADFFVAGCHKWLFGPRGTGVVWGTEEAWRQTLPIIPSFIESDVHAEWLEGNAWSGPTTAAAMSPGGFKPFEHRFALIETFDFHDRIGRARIAERTHALARQCKEGLAAIDGVTVRTPMDPALSAGIVAFDVDGEDPWSVVRALRRAGVIASVAPYQSRHVRLTPSIVNTPDEVDRAVAAVADLA